MKAVEFESQVAPLDQIPIPGEIACQIPAGSNVHVIVMWGDGEQDDWRDLARERFASAYAPEDDVYEKLIDDPPSR